jgi:hypothetical protein
VVRETVKISFISRLQSGFSMAGSRLKPALQQFILGRTPPALALSLAKFFTRRSGGLIE